MNNLKVNMYNVSIPEKEVSAMKKELLECTNYFLLKKEGFTFRMNESGELEVPASGFIVSVTPMIENISIDINSVISYVLENKTMTVREREYDLYVGGWFDEREDDFCIDISIVTENIEEAIELGKMTDQKAIYNLAEENSLYI